MGNDRYAPGFEQRQTCRLVEGALAPDSIARARLRSSTRAEGGVGGGSSGRAEKIAIGEGAAHGRQRIRRAVEHGHPASVSSSADCPSRTWL